MYTKHGPGSMDHHGPPHGPGPWTTPNFQNEITPVNMKIYWRSRYEKNTDSYLLCSSRKSGLQTHFEIQKILCISMPNIFFPTLLNCNSDRKSVV